MTWVMQECDAFHIPFGYLKTTDKTEFSPFQKECTKRLIISGRGEFLRISGYLVIKAG